MILHHIFVSLEKGSNIYVWPLATDMFLLVPCDKKLKVRLLTSCSSGLKERGCGKEKMMNTESALLAKHAKLTKRAANNCGVGLVQQLNPMPCVPR